MKEVLTQKIADALAAQPPRLTRRDVHVPAVRAKAKAVIGMRRSGKTTFLWQCIRERLERRGFQAAYVRMRQGHEVDFLATAPGEAPQLIQVSLDISNSSTREREERALAAAAAEFPDATPFLVTLDSMPPEPPLPAALNWRPAAAWLLGSPGARPGDGDRTGSERDSADR